MSESSSTENTKTLSSSTLPTQRVFSERLATILQSRRSDRSQSRKVYHPKGTAKKRFANIQTQAKSNSPVLQHISNTSFCEEVFLLEDTFHHLSSPGPRPQERQNNPCLPIVLIKFVPFWSSYSFWSYQHIRSDAPWHRTRSKNFSVICSTKKIISQETTACQKYSTRESSGFFW